MAEYLNHSRVSAQEHKRKRLITIGCIIVFFFGFGFIGGLTGYTPELKDGTLLYLFFALPGVYLLYCAYQITQWNELATRYGSILNEDADGFVHIDELSRQAGKESGMVHKELETLFRKGYFTDCTFQRGGNPGVILGNANKAQEDAFVVVKCPSCGGINRIRKNSYGICEYCGSRIEA